MLLLVLLSYDVTVLILALQFLALWYNKSAKSYSSIALRVRLMPG